MFFFRGDRSTALRDVPLCFLVSTMRWHQDTGSPSEREMERERERERVREREREMGRGRVRGRG